MGFNSGFKGLNIELNLVCHLLALLGAYPILHVSKIRVKQVSLVSEISRATLLTHSDILYSCSTETEL